MAPSVTAVRTSHQGLSLETTRRELKPFVDFALRKHLGGQHDQSTHGNWAAGQGSVSGTDFRAEQEADLARRNAERLDLAERHAWSHGEFSEILARASFAAAGMDRRLVEPVITRLHELDVQFPKVLRKVQMTNQDQPGVWAEATPGDGVITLMPAWRNKGRLERQIMESTLRSFHPPGSETIEAVLTHEFGHLLESSLFDFGGGKGPVEAVVPENARSWTGDRGPGTKVWMTPLPPGKKMLSEWAEGQGEVGSWYDEQERRVIAFAARINPVLGTRHRSGGGSFHGFRFTAQTRQKIKDGLSEYATVDAGEFFAEAFTEYMHSPSPRPIARAVGDFASEYYRDTSTRHMELRYYDRARAPLEKHLQGRHDQSSHGNRARGGEEIEPAPVYYHGTGSGGQKLSIGRRSVGHEEWDSQFFVTPDRAVAQRYAERHLHGEVREFRLVTRVFKPYIEPKDYTPDRLVSILRQARSAGYGAVHFGGGIGTVVLDQSLATPVAKHLAGQHDQSTHGNWARGGAKPLYWQTEAEVVGEWTGKETREEADARFDRRREWKAAMRKALATGDITQEEADALGYYAGGHETSHGGWKPLPDVLYHVTTAGSAVERDGLKTRDELQQESGLGLGGGESDTISFTTDRRVAAAIYVGLHEMRKVAAGDIWAQDLLNRAEEGRGAQRPYLSDIMRYYDKGWKKGNSLPRGIQDLINGVERSSAVLWDTQEEYRARRRKEGDPRADEWVGDTSDANWDTPKGRVFASHTRPLSDADLANETVDLYKRFSTYREIAGGQPDPLFFTSDTQALSKTDPNEIRLLQFHPRTSGPALGYQVSGMGEWRTTTGEVVEFDQDLADNYSLPAA